MIDCLLYIPLLFLVSSETPKTRLTTLFTSTVINFSHSDLLLIHPFPDVLVRTSDSVNFKLYRNLYVHPYSSSVDLCVQVKSSLRTPHYTYTLRVVQSTSCLLTESFLYSRPRRVVLLQPHHSSFVVPPRRTGTLSSFLT